MAELKIYMWIKENKDWVGFLKFHDINIVHSRYTSLMHFLTQERELEIGEYDANEEKKNAIDPKRENDFDEHF